MAKKASLGRANLIGGGVCSQRKGYVAEEMPKKMVQGAKKRNLPLWVVMFI